jgi:hypothetical protein
MRINEPTPTQAEEEEGKKRRKKRIIMVTVSSNHIRVYTLQSNILFKDFCVVAEKERKIFQTLQVSPKK